MDFNSGETLAVVFLAAMIFLYRRQQAFISLLKYPLRLAAPQRVERATMPAQTAQLLDGARQELEAAGFRYALTEAAPPLNLVDPRPLVYSDVYWNPEKSTVAVARLAEPYTGQTFSIYYLTAFAGGRKLLTTNRILWSLFPALPEYARQDAYADNFRSQWDFHLKALAREADPVIDGLDEVLQSEQDSMPRLFAHLQHIGWIRPESPGIFRFTAWGAWQYARRQLSEAKKVAAALKRPYQHAQAPDAEALRSAEMTGFATSIELAAQPLPQWLKAVMFGLTLLASMLLFGRQITFTGAAALLLVLLVHELGHLAAMWAFGFRNLSILFLPFFGAVAMGHKTHVKPWQEAVILLAGPVPGLVLALFATQVSLDGLAPQAAEFFRWCFWFALVINLFNLLPLSILDGGKLFQLAVLSRFPYARVIFGAAGSAIGLVYSLMNGSLVLAIAMIMVLLGVSYQLKGAKAVSAIRARAREQGMSSLGKEEAIALLAQHLAQPEFNDPSVKGWLLRTRVAAIAYPRLLQGVPRLGTSLGVLAAHGAAFFVPVLIGFALLHQPAQAPLLRHDNAEQSDARRQAKEKREALAQAAREQFMARYEAERDPEKKWTMLMWDEDEQGRPLALDPDWATQQQDELEKLLPDDHPVKLGGVLALAKAETDKTRAAEITLSVIARLTENDLRRAITLDAGRFGTLEAAYDHLARVAEPGVLADEASRLEAFWPELNGQPHEQDWRKQSLALAGAHVSLAAGNQPAAEIWMDRHLASCTCARKEHAAYTRAWFLLDIGRAEEALELAARALDAPDISNRMRNEWRTLAGWAEMARGHAREADAYFQATLQKQGSREQQFDVGSWLLGLIVGNGSGQDVPREISEGMLDHLAALESYDPPEATRYREELAAIATPEWKQYSAPHVTGRVDGWGKEREEVLGRLAKSL